MKITLIQIDMLLGSRILLSLLLEKGFDAKSLQINLRYTDTLSSADLDRIYTYVADADVVGLSFNTFYANIAKELAQFLKKKGVKYLVVGGHHATALPQEVVSYADIVVRYEAEITLPKILDALKEGPHELSKIKGIIYRIDGKIYSSGDAPDIVWNLDTLPFPSLDTRVIKFFDLKRKIYTPSVLELVSHDPGIYIVLASRGCIFNCTYCSNSLYRTIDKRFSSIRKRSIDNILEELRRAKRLGFSSFYISDDNFFAFTLEEIRQFAKGYARKINRPFSIMGVNPNDFRSSSSEEKLKILLNCGMSDIRIGIQSGSDRTLRLFNRGYKAAELPRLLAPIEKNRKTIWPHPHDTLNVVFDVICDSPWETDEDKIATIKMMLNLTSQYAVLFYTLIYLPGTKIYAHAMANGWIADKDKDIYSKGIAGIEDNIYNRLLYMIAVAKERGGTFSNAFINHILSLRTSSLDAAKEIVDSVIHAINNTEQHHKINLRHAATHQYLTGFTEWVKTRGHVGKKVLLRSYHEPYG